MRLDPLPSQCLVDHSLAIRVRDLSPGELVTLRLRSRFNDAVLLSEASYRSDAAGVVDLAVNAPLSGSYRGVDPMGLFWSRAPVLDDRAVDIREFSSDPLTATLIVEGVNREERIVHAIRRVYVGPGVSVREIDHDGLVGKFFEPEGPDPHPAILIVGGSNGGLAWSQEMAALLAARGFATLSLAYFAAPGLSPTLDRIPLEYFGKALEWLASQPSVAADRVGVVGVSRGGELALLLGANYSCLRSVVAYVPSGIAWPAYPPSGHGAWTLGGHEIPYASTLTYEEWDAAVAAGRARQDSFDWYLIPLQDADYLEKVSIPVERINGPVLLISGADDGLWPSTELSELAVQRARLRNGRHRVEHLAYEGAGHSIAWPGGPTTMLRSTHPVSGEEINVGGTPEGTAKARSDSWPKVIAFLERSLSAEASPGPD